MVDTAESLLGIEWIEGNNVRSLLGGEEEPEDEEGSASESGSDNFHDEEFQARLGAERPESPLSEYGISQGE